MNVVKQTGGSEVEKRRDTHPFEEAAEIFEDTSLLEEDL